jgi:hypothetical protein
MVPIVVFIPGQIPDEEHGARSKQKAVRLLPTAF